MDVSDASVLQVYAGVRRDASTLADTTCRMSGADQAIVEVTPPRGHRRATEWMSAFDPAWSPDGKRIAFTTGQDIALLTLDGGDVTRLTQGSEAAWSPDSSKLVFRSQANGLFSVNVDGSNRQRLTTGNHHAPARRP